MCERERGECDGGGGGGRERGREREKAGRELWGRRLWLLNCDCVQSGSAARRVRVRVRVRVWMCAGIYFWLNGTCGCRNYAVAEATVTVAVAAAWLAARRRLKQRADPKATRPVRWRGRKRG